VFNQEKKENTRSPRKSFKTSFKKKEVEVKENPGLTTYNQVKKKKTGLQKAQGGNRINESRQHPNRGELTLAM